MKVTFDELVEERNCVMGEGSAFGDLMREGSAFGDLAEEGDCVMRESFAFGDLAEEGDCAIGEGSVKGSDELVEEKLFNVEGDLELVSGCWNVLAEEPTLASGGGHAKRKINTLKQHAFNIPATRMA